MVTVLAFAAFEANPLQGVVQLFRGFAIQLAYRWGSHQVMTDDEHAVLMWSRLNGRWSARRFANEVLGVVFAVMVGVFMFVLSNMLITVVLRTALQFAGVSNGTQAIVIVSVIALRLVLTLRGAWLALRLDHKRMALLEPGGGEAWRIDYLAAQPLGAGHGSALVRRFLAAADEADASICLVTDPRNRDFYRRNGFRVANVSDHAGDLGDRLLMVRRAPSLRRSARLGAHLTVAA
jgi:GNAT superfamily N-acetyltransferase